MELSIISKYKLLLAKLSGELDHHSINFIREDIERELLRKGVRNLAMDFSNVSFMDSSAIGIVMGRYKTVNALGGRVIICGISDKFKRMFKMCGMEKAVIISDTLEQGMEELENE